MKGALPLVLFALAGLACEDAPPSTATPTAIVTAVPATAAPRSTIEPPGARYPDDRVPVAEDFEEEAAKAVTAENYESELGRLEAEIGGVEPPADGSAKPSAPPSAPPSAGPSEAAGKPPPAAPAERPAP